MKIYSINRARGYIVDDFICAQKPNLQIVYIR